jgi:subtilisin family serine protease
MEELSMRKKRNSKLKAKLRWFSVLILVLVFLSGSAQVNALSFQASAIPSGLGKVAPQVHQALESTAKGDMVSVIVTLKAQADLSNIGGLDREARLKGLIRALQAVTEASQKDIKAIIEARMAQGLVSQVTYFWVFNGLSLTAAPEVIEELAARPDVLKITSDEISIEPEAGLAASAPEQNISVVNAPALWDLGYHGEGIVVANMDTGVDGNHPELNPRWRGGSNSWFDPYGQHPVTPTDLSGHGTWTMGVMVGGDASGTSIGLAPQALWMAVKIFNDSGSATATAIHRGYQWLLDPDGDINTADAPHVVNNSWAFSYPGCDLEFELDLLALRTAGILPVFAAGNGGPNTGTSYSPGNYPQALAVGAINNSDQIYTYSSRGPSACGEAQNYYPELVAPGVSVHTSDLYNLYYDATGTSLAAPHVSGSLALLLSAFPNLSVADQEYALTDNAIDLGSTGPDNDFGFGRLDVLAAHQFLYSGGVAPTPTAASSENLALNKPVTVSSFQDNSATGDRAVDGDLNTLWKTKKANGKNSSSSEWIKIDLGNSAEISQVVLEWDANYATSYSLQVSEDDSVWNTLFTDNNADGGSDVLLLSSVVGRYIMLETVAWNDSSLRNWLREFQVYGSLADPSPTSTATPTPVPPGPTPTPTASPGGGETIHVGDLDGSASAGSRNRWHASVTITVHDAYELPVSAAAVSGSWSNGVSGNDACVTDSAGRCTLTKENIKNNNSSVTFTVTDVTAALKYEPSANHDPDADSDGTVIMILKP